MKAEKKKMEEEEARKEDINKGIVKNRLLSFF